MGRKQVDSEIAKRAGRELIRLYGSVEKASQQTGLTKSPIYSWILGTHTPDAWALKKMAACGMDVHYILTGVRYG